MCEGAYSICLKCIRRIDNQEFAVKVIDSVYDVTNEIKFLNICKGHPAIVKLIETFYEDNYTYIVMEYLNGGILTTRKNLMDNDLKTIAIQIINGLNFIHQHGIVHCDIKPENILYVNENSYDVKIIDFGSAKFCNDHTMNDDCNHQTFTLDYAAPEIIANRKIDYNCDVWSFGATMYKLVCGNFPFRYTCRDTSRQISNTINDGNYNRIVNVWKNLSVNIKHVIDSTLQVLPQNRASLQELIAIMNSNDKAIDLSRGKLSVDIVNVTVVNKKYCKPVDNQTNMFYGFKIEDIAVGNVAAWNAMQKKMKKKIKILYLKTYLYENRKITLHHNQKNYYQFLKQKMHSVKQISPKIRKDARIRRSIR